MLPKAVVTEGGAVGQAYRAGSEAREQLTVGAELGELLLHQAPAVLVAEHVVERLLRGTADTEQVDGYTAVRRVVQRRAALDLAAGWIGDRIERQ